MTAEVGGDGRGQYQKWDGWEGYRLVVAYALVRDQTIGPQSH